VSEKDRILVAIDQQNVLRNIAEDIKLPLLRILTEVQVARLSGDINHSSIETTIDTTMRLLDNYILTTQLYNGQLELELEPVAVSAVMYDSAEYLYKYAKLLNCTVEVVVPSRTSVLAMADKSILQAALISLGYSFLHTATNAKQSKNTITYVAGVHNRAIVAGIFSKEAHISARDLRASRNLGGTARQPLQNFSYTSSSGIYIADALFSAMQAPMSIKRHKYMGGIGANLLPSRQLALL
jgi:K+-sensing histidine kinase KdpD